ncbi:MAG: hypothetical protein WDO24_11815 [Pseudomonadota bacterium]
MPALIVQGVAAQAQAQLSNREVAIGFGASVTSTDPHYHNLTTNTMIARHFFEGLVVPDAQIRMHPGLAESCGRWTTRPGNSSCAGA